MTSLSGNLTEPVLEFALVLDQTNKFQNLFRKYRLKAEFSTLSEFGSALSEKGFIYDDSIFSHWQKGTRIPQNRALLIALIQVFLDRHAISTVEEANEFLASARLGFLSDSERKKLHFSVTKNVFQVPSEIVNFNGREKIIKRLSDPNNIRGKVIVIHGPAGVGKTALAIRLGHLLRNAFNDGVFWFKIEDDNAGDILLSLAKEFGEDISSISNKHVRSTVVRSLLSDKNVLLFLDSAELSDEVSPLIPNSPKCTTIITSQKNYVPISMKYEHIQLESFTDKEVLSLFKDVLRNSYHVHGKDKILKVAKRVGNLPLAVHILARQLLHSEMHVSQLPDLLSEQHSVFKDMYYEHKSLYSTINLSYNKLDTTQKTALLSASVFKGKDFSSDAVGYINGLSGKQIIPTLQTLTDLSLLEHSRKNRYRIHPAVKEFALSKLNPPRSSLFIFLAVAMYIFFLGGGITAKFLLQSGFYASLLSATYFVIALYGSFCGFYTSIRWGGLKTTLGKSVLMFSIGLLLQSFGQVSYAYYIHVHNITVPYPSIGDIGYFGTIPFYIYGVLLLSKASGINLTRSFKRKFIAIVVPVAILLFGYFLFLQNYVFDFSNPLKVFLDFAYPLGEAVFVSIALLIFILSRKTLDGIMKSKALLLLGALFLQYLSDYIFLYKSEEYTSASYIDVLYLTSYFVMTLSLLNLKSLQVKIKST